MLPVNYGRGIMKKRTDNHTSTINGGRSNFHATHEQVSKFANCLTADLAERGESLHNNTAIDGCYRSIAFDITQITASALSSWTERRGTAKEFGNIVGRLCLALARADIAVGLCSNRAHWKPPARTMRILAGFSEN